MSAPTEQDIREAIEREIAEGRSSGSTGDSLASELRLLISDIADPLTNAAFFVEAGDEYNSGQPEPRDMWWNLRLTEARRLREITKSSMERAAERCEAIIVEELTAAGLQFRRRVP